MVGVLFALGAAVSSGAEKLLRRHVLIKEDSLCYAFAFGLFAAIILLPVFIFGFQAPTHNLAWLLLILSGSIWTVFSLLQFKAYSYLEASIASPISRVKLFFVLILGVIFLNETISLGKVAGTLLIFIGIVVLSYKKNVKRPHIEKKGIALIILSTMLISVALLIDKYALNFFTVATYTAPIYLMKPILLIPWVMKRKHHIKSIFKQSLIAVFATSALSVGYYYLTLMAFKQAEASAIVPITEMSTLFAVIGGIVILKERTFITRKLIAATIVVFGAILVALA